MAHRSRTSQQRARVRSRPAPPTAAGHPHEAGHVLGPAPALDAVTAELLQSILASRGAPRPWAVIEPSSARLSSVGTCSIAAMTVCIFEHVPTAEGGGRLVTGTALG